ncbi:528_t:CDS:2, partial [Acaulospora morrowiae]
RLLKKVDPDNALPQTYEVQMFIGGLQGKIAFMLSIIDSETLEDAMAKAKKIEARDYYGGLSVEEVRHTPLEDIQELATNYAKLAMTVSTQSGSRTRSKIDIQDVTCFKCRKKGHYARSCITEGTKPQSATPVTPVEHEAEVCYVELEE